MQARKRDLRRAGYSHHDLAVAADVTVSMAWKWMNGVRDSARCAEAYARLIRNGRG